MMNSFGAFVKKTRKDLGLTANEFGERIGLGKSSVYLYEGNKLPNRKKLPQYAEALCLPLEEIKKAYDENHAIYLVNGDLQESHEHIIDGYLALVRQKYLEEEDSRTEIRRGLENLLVV